MMSVLFSHEQQLSHAINPKIWWFYQQLQTDADKPLELNERTARDDVAVF
jgi:hypothetical protein